MADRICSKCGVAAEPKLKFCRECGGRVEEAVSPDAPTGPVGGVGGSHDATLAGALRAAPGGGAPDPEESEEPGPPARRGRLAGSGDETLIAGLSARTAKSPSPAGSGDETIMTGAFREKGGPAAPPADEVADDLQRTFLGTSLPGMAPPKPSPAAAAPPPPAAPPPAPPPPAPSPPPAPAPRAAAPPPAAPPPPATDPAPAPSPAADRGGATRTTKKIVESFPEATAPDAAEAPVQDDLGVGDDTGEVVPGADLEEGALSRSAAPGSSPPPAPPAVPPAPGAAPPLAGARPRLEHWSPRLKGEMITLEKDDTVVGRDRGDLKYPTDAYLSKKHGRFFRDGEGRLCVEDFGTLNGTHLRLSGAVRLEHRDVILLGRHTFRFELLQYVEKDDRTIEGDPLTRVQGVQGTAPRARLVKRQDEGFRGLPYYFGTNRYVLGRTDGTHNFQRDDRMSRRHAALQFRDGDYWLEDLGSQNGTFLRLRGPRVLRPGDEILMGDQYFRLVE
jgi:pSer/pThr/pTyr-binding forkhead associated (FHA) protein